MTLPLRLLWACCCAMAPAAWAMLHIEITQGFEQAIPIGVVPFASAYQQGHWTEDVGTIVGTDLRQTGQFHVQDPKGHVLPHRTQDVDFAAWQKAGVEVLLVGRMRPLPSNQVRVQFDLIDLYQTRDNWPAGADQAPAASTQVHWHHAVLLSQSFQVPVTQLRRLGHHVADLVYEKLTGTRGIFSTKIAYVSVSHTDETTPYRLEIADPDGHNAVTLLASSEPVMSPRWDPQGKRLAYVSFELKRSAVYILDVATGKRERVAAYPGINAAPSWSPDGQSLALVLSHEVAPKLYVLDLKTHALRKLTQGSSVDTEPSWSPDGRHLVFTSNRGGRPQIYRYTLATGHIERLTYHGRDNTRASYTPDGRSLVMLHREGKRYNIAVQSLATGALRVLTHSRLDESPSVSPNGLRVVHATRDGQHVVLGMVSLDGKVKLRLPARQGDVQEPAWSPFL